MNATKLTQKEMASLEVGEALTIATVMVIFTIVILTVVAFKLFSSQGAKVTLPDGYTFEWKSAISTRF